MTEEKLKVKALSEELEDPQNLNRWRFVGFNEVEPFEVIEKIKQLQQSLIRKTEQIIAQNLKIQANKQQVVSFQDIIQKNPGFKEARLILLKQKHLKKKIRKLKSVAAELNMYRFKINDASELTESYKSQIFQKKKDINSKLMSKSRSFLPRISQHN